MPRVFEMSCAYFFATIAETSLSCLLLTFLIPSNELMPLVFKSSVISICTPWALRTSCSASKCKSIVSTMTPSMSKITARSKQITFSHSAKARCRPCLAFLEKQAGNACSFYLFQKARSLFQKQSAQELGEVHAQDFFQGNNRKSACRRARRHFCTRAPGNSFGYLCAQDS